MLRPSVEHSRVRIDDHGVMRVGEGRGVMLESIIIPFQRSESAESIRSQYPRLTLEQVYGEIAYYLGHRGQVDAYLTQQPEVWTRMRADAEKEPSPARDRLRAAKAEIKTGRRP